MESSNGQSHPASDAQTPDTRALFESLVLPELEVLYQVARSLAQSETAAERLVEATLAEAHRTITHFDGHEPRVWLLGILREARLSTESASVEADVINLQSPTAVALSALPQKFRSVVELIDLHQLSYHETASVLGVPEGTVMSRLHRARRNMRKGLETATIAL